MPAVLDNIWVEAKRLSRYEKIELLERLIRQLRIEEKPARIPVKWDQIYGIAKGVWDTDAQEYINRLREDRT